MPTVVERLDARMRQAFAHPMFNELRRIIPRAEQNDPRMLAAWLAAAAGMDPAGATAEPYLELRGACSELTAARGLVDRVGSIYNNPTVQRLAGDKLGWVFWHARARPHGVAEKPPARRRGA